MTNIKPSVERRRLYKELIMAVLEHAPEEDLLSLAEDYASSGGSLAAYHSNIKECLAKAVKDAENYYPHYQRGCGSPVLKKSPLGRKLAKGAFSEANEET